MDEPRSPPEVAVLIVCYNGAAYLPECLDSLQACATNQVRQHVVVVDNASSDGSAELVAGQYPHVRLIRSRENLRFAAGNNLGWQYLAEHLPSAEFVCLLNQDTVVTSGWLEPLVGHLRQHTDVAAVQPLLLLHPQTDRINSAGNRSHFLGFGFTRSLGEPNSGQYDQPEEIDYASGAAVLVRTALLHRLGLFESPMVAYLEDADLSWKLRQAGFRVCLVPASCVYHKYEFKSDYRHYEHLERNRWWLLLVYYRWPTLVLLLPAWLLMEAGQWWFAVRQGVAGQKWRAMAYFLSPRHLGHVWQLRRAAQRRRVVSDAVFLAHHAGRIDTPLAAQPLLRYVANPLLGAYWALARRLICW
jgi:GT2 family glycosyltransferase